MFSDIFTLFMLRRKIMENWHDTSNLGSQRYTGSWFNKGTNSIDHRLQLQNCDNIWNNWLSFVFFNAYGKSMKLAS